jgi:hypothetical protein
MADAYDWRVVYRRRGWRAPQRKTYKKKGSADGFIRKLAAGGRDDLALLVALRLEKRPKGTRYGGWVLVRDYAAD